MTLPDFSPAFPLPWIISLAAAAALFTIYRAIRGASMKPAWFQLPAVLLRLCVIALLALVLMNPSKRMVIENPKRDSLILLDRSSSMKLGASEKDNRWTEARKWVESASAAITRKTGVAPHIAVFDHELENLSGTAALAEMKPAGNQTRLASAVASVLQRGGEQAPRQIVIVSDGRTHDRHELPKALGAARDAGAKISTKVIGADTPPRNAWIAAVQAPRSVRPKAKLSVHVELASTGISAYEPMALVLTEEGGKEVARTVFQPQESAGAPPVEKVLNFEIGLRSTKYSLQLVPASDEVATDDNHFGFTVEVSSSKLRVLFVEGTHVKRSVGETGHWYNDMELMTKAWDATGEIEYECLTPVSEYVDSPNLVGVTFKNGEMRQDPSKSFPATREDLYRFDVMLISDVPVGNFSNDQMQWVVDWVNERGGGFLMGGGYTTFDVGNYDQTPWERIIPVDMLAYGAGFMEKPFPIRIPDAVRNHPLWHVSDDPDENNRALNAHPIFTGMNRVKRAKPGAIVLAVRADTEGDEPVIAAQSYGRGRSIAWLPDPNGGWARNYVKWGPPGGPRQGQHTELGHGAKFRFKEASANSASGPPPPHPAPWYGQYWVNLVKWLGEPSIRWHRDKLAGRSVAASAKPGSLLPVAAEVLAVTKLDDLLTLDVGARLDIPGTPRIRLEYDRDAREFVGQLPIPSSAEGEQISVYFDASANGSSFTDIVPVSLRHSNPEFIETAPDKAFMQELADAAAGRTLDSPADAANWIAEITDAETQRAAATWDQPLWPRWPLLGAIIALLCLEWLVRRGSLMPAAATAAVFFICGSLPAQESRAVDELIGQLDAPKVRLRDEAEDLLKTMPAAMEALNKAGKDGNSEEARLRANNALRELRQLAWALESEMPIHQTTVMGFGVVASPDGKHFYTRGEEGALLWDIEKLNPQPIGVETLGTWRDVRRMWPPITFALSPDGGKLVTGSDFGNFLVHDTLKSTRLMNLMPPDDANGFAAPSAPTTDAAYSPDGKRLATASYSSLIYHWDPTSGALLFTEKLPTPAQRIVFSPDSRFLAHGIYRPGVPDVIWVQKMDDRSWSAKIETSAPVNGLAFSPDGTMLATALRDGSYNIHAFNDGTLGSVRVLLRTKGAGRAVLFTADGKSLFVCGTDPADAMQQIDLTTGEVIWKAPLIAGGCSRIALLGEDRLLVACGGVLRIWKKRM